ncbi:geranylgeranyl transferase type-1 subunit beta-like [Halichondria panicea]|uniref:geranylgeranyl transferase type-1 subunit beta-like n=1 Tax=Halichondria panicea TaxID=6063 RepID=UPI00312B71F6
MASRFVLIENIRDSRPGKMSEAVEEEVLLPRHIKYAKRIMGVLPTETQGLDTSRMTILFFGVSGLDVLDGLSEVSCQDKADMVDWIYAQQILPNKSHSNLYQCGFRGGSFIGAPYQPTSSQNEVNISYNTSHIAMTYTALASLLVLGDDLSRVNREGVLAGVRHLQQKDGSFCSTAEGTENDMRFVYCACCVCYMLNDWKGMDVVKAAEFIKTSQSYDHGIAQGPLLESHGGSTFCAIASLSLMGRLDSTFSPAELERLKKWCIRRQQTGFNGRPNKPVDTCYSFWVGASLKLLGIGSLVDSAWNRRYILSTQCSITGGFSKWPECHPDPLHTYLGLCGLSLNGEKGVCPIHAALNISQRAADWLKTLHTNT